MVRTAAGRTGSSKAKAAASKTSSSRSRSKSPQGSRSKPARASSPRRFAKPFLLVLALLAFVLVAALGVANIQGEKETPALRPDGLPSYITDEMVQTAQDMQKQYGHPAGCTLAQIIQESGQGTGLSALAEQDNNLFGMKWAASFEGKPGVVGPVDWGTNEEYDGATVSITGTFIRFESQKACIEFRSSVFLQASTYADNPTIKRAIETGNSALMAWGLQDAGWATDSSYAEHLVLLMDQYDLYRFDE